MQGVKPAMAKWERFSEIQSWPDRIFLLVLVLVVVLRPRITDNEDEDEDDNENETNPINHRGLLWMALPSS